VGYSLDRNNAVSPSARGKNVDGLLDPGHFAVEDEYPEEFVVERAF